MLKGVTTTKQQRQLEDVEMTSSSYATCHLKRIGDDEKLNQVWSIKRSKESEKDMLADYTANIYCRITVLQIFLK